MSPTVQTLLLGFLFLIAMLLAGHLMGHAADRRKAIFGFLPLRLAYCVWHLRWA